MPSRWSRQTVARTSPRLDEAVVVSVSEEATQAGLEILEAGGNAVDAAVAVALACAVVEPVDATIGGSGFLLAHDSAGGRSWSVEFPPRAPQSARADMFRIVESTFEPAMGVSLVADDANSIGYRAPGVPAAAAGLCLAQERLGRLDLARVVEPAVRLCEGFRPSSYFALQALDCLDALRRYPGSAAAYLVDGLPAVPAFHHPVTGEQPPQVVQPDLGRTLEILGARGADGFYRGEVAERLVAGVAEHGGLLTLDDLAAYEATTAEPLRRSYRGVQVLAAAAPNGGWTELQLLAILERFPLGKLAPDSPEAIHLLVEASRRSFADRYRFHADPDVVDVPLERLLSDAYADEVAGQIDPDRVGLRFDGTDQPPWVAFTEPLTSLVEPHGHGYEWGTTHLSVIDGEGLAVSCTFTAGNGFGSKVVAEGTGVLLDSGMLWFDARPGYPNSIAPGKRPLTNMGPLMLAWDDGRVLAVGASGGRRIPSAVTQVVLNAVDHGMSASEAIAAPRIDASGTPVLASTRLPASTRDALRELGHPVVDVTEDHEPFSYEFARPVAAAVDGAGVRSGGITPWATGFVAGW
jgi:gamma-glutamyltranspeptidase/glutathione hydrolase